MEFNVGDHHYSFNIYNGPHPSLNNIYVRSMDVTDGDKDEIMNNHYSELIEGICGVVERYGIEYDSHHNHITPFNREESREMEIAVRLRMVSMVDSFTGG